MISKIKKTVHYIKGKGLILTFLKIWDYILFKGKSKRKVFKTMSIYNDEFAVVTNPKGINLMYKNILLTNNIGFHSALKNLEKWHDSTQSEFYFQKLSSNQILAKQHWWNLPLTQYWKILLKNNKILWQVFLETENSIAIEEFKAGIILNAFYNRLEIKTADISLPKIDDTWRMTGIPPDTKEALFKAKKNLPNIPKLKFSIIDSINTSRVIVQNTNGFLNGRFIQAAILNEVLYNTGHHHMFKIMLEFVLS